MKRGKKKKMLTYNKFRRNVKAISPVLSVLMMIAVAVAASLVTYAWVMGYLGFTTNKVGKAIQIQSIASDGSVYVQNVGDAQVVLADAYLNGALATSTWNKADGSGLLTGNVLLPGETAVCDVGGPFGPGSKITVKVTTTDGTFNEMTKQFS
ncbi:MAG: archaellin/type IV pilin N-terminal domain-containing protein [Candidatus Bathyarchaeia archaeon]